MFKFNLGGLISPVQMLAERVISRGLKAIGRHIIVEAFGCSREVLDNPMLLRKTLIDAARKANMEICGEIFHEFNPQGVTGVVVVKESHLSIHTWPEFGYASIDIFTCGSYSDPWKAYDCIIKALRPKSVQVMELKRGIMWSGG